MTSNERDAHVQGLRAQGLSQTAIARTLGISRRTVGRIIQRLDQGFAPETLILHPIAQRAGLPPLWAMPEPSREIGREPSDTPATPSSEPSQASGSPPSGEDRRHGAAAIGAEATAPPPTVETLPHIAQQLQDVATRISQVEAPQLHHAEARARHAEEALDQALQGVQNVRAEQWKMMRDVTQSVGELLQATGQLLQHLPKESR
jgi:transcriptional regulator with XRE-family HTH domain